MATKYSLIMIKKFFSYLLCYLIFPLSYLVPRSEHKIAFGSYRGGFNGNSKYLFIHNSLQGRDAVWLSNKRSTIRQVRSMGLRAYHVLSPRGAWRALRSKYWVVNSYTSDIFWAFSGGAFVLNLWHGVGVKRIEYNALGGEIYDRYIRKTFRQAFFHPESFRRPDRLVTGSPALTEMFSSAFRIPPEHCIPCGYPRNSIFKLSEAQLFEFAKHYSPTTYPLMQRCKSYSRVWLYMPTWRENQKEVFREILDLPDLQETLAQKNELLILKPHANSVLNGNSDFGNIAFLDNRMDPQPLLPLANVLITDYSSVFYDYILLEGRSIVLFTYDKDEYLSRNPSWFPYEENVAGQEVSTFQSLLEIFKKGPEPLNESRRKALIHKFWNDNPYVDNSVFFY